MRITSFALLMFVLLLSACGQKGPLYLPQDGSAPAASASTGDNTDVRSKKPAGQ